MTTEHIHKDVETLPFDKHGGIIEDKISYYSIDFDIIINTSLNQMCKDLINLLKRDDVFHFDITRPVSNGVNYEIKDTIWDLALIRKIVFEEYYLMIDDYKIFYNEIMGFSKRIKW